jgi:hypothetical protein
MGSLPRKVPPLEERLPTEPAGKVEGDRFTAFIPSDRMNTGDPFHLRKRRKNIGHQRECPRGIFIVAIEPRHYLAGRPREPFVNRIVLSLVRLTHPIGQTVFILTDNLSTSIGRTTIDYYIFQVRISLIKYRTYGLFDKLPLVE